MANEMQEEDVTRQVREKLNQRKIKLWLPPYTEDGSRKGQHPQELIDQLSTELNHPVETVAAILEKLRCHALEKLAAKQKFKESGVATVKVKLAGNVPESARAYTKGSGLNAEVGLQFCGKQLKEVIAAKSGIDILRLKVICSGHVIEDDRPVGDQHVRNGSQLMALCLSETEAEARCEEEQKRKVAKTRAAAEFLSSKVDGGESDDQNYYLQIADQTGKPLDLPVEEKKALTLAMTMHEKGRAALKRKEYSEALLLLLEADGEFKKCRSDILNAVDNYAILCLDIVWCYLCLKNVSDLPDAETRLRACDDCFRKSYGPNLERLALVKGETGSQKALFMRLHLLQGILAYHQGQRSQAMALLSRAESELGRLKVDEDKMTQVMSMGFTQQEARLGLRACEGSVQLAVSHIMKKKEEKRERKEKEKEERRKKKIAKTLGQTASGQQVNVESYESLLEMGFPKGASAEALRQANNDLPQALQILQDHPDLLTLPDPKPAKLDITDAMIAQVTAMGFDPQWARAALNHFHGNIRRSIEELLQRAGQIPQEWLDALTALSPASTPSTPSTSTAGSESASPVKSPEELEAEKEIMESIIPDIPEEEEDYLDLTLEEESTFLQEYLSLLMSTS